MNMRILFLTREPHPSFRPDIATLFGKALPLRNINSDLLALGIQEGTALWGGGAVITSFASTRLGKLLARIALPFRLFNLPYRRRYDAIQVRDRIFGAFVGLLAARWHGLPFFYWMSYPFPEAWLDLGDGADPSNSSAKRRFMWRWRGRLASWMLYKVILPRSRHIFVQSEAMREMLSERGITKEDMTAVPMGVSIPARVEDVVPSEDPRLVGRPVLVYLGALERIRHPEIMIEAMVQVVAERPDALLVLVGDSQIKGEREWLETEVKRFGLSDHVLITGWMESTLALRYLRTATLGFSPVPRTRVLDVGSPTKVCEYLAFGVPVVANDQRDQAELISQTLGGYCVTFSAQAFANAALELLNNPEMARKMGERGRVEVRKLRSYDILAEQLASRYETLLG